MIVVVQTSDTLIIKERKLIAKPVRNPKLADTKEKKSEVSFQADMETAIYRLLLLSYVPTGFWPRLITRLLAEDSIVDILRSYFNIPRHVRWKHSFTERFMWTVLTFCFHYCRKILEFLGFFFSDSAIVLVLARLFLSVCSVNRWIELRNCCGRCKLFQPSFEHVMQVVGDVDIAQSLEWKAEWRCWQTGIELQYLGTTLLRIKEVTQRVGVSPFDYRSFRCPHTTY